MLSHASLASFDFDADIAMSELRSEETLTERLHEDVAVRAIIAERSSTANFVLATDRTWSKIAKLIIDSTF